MAEKSDWFDEGIEHSSSEMAEFFAGAFSTGVNVYGNPNSLLVERTTGMNIKVNSGIAYINGRYYNSGGDLAFALSSAADSTKYFRIVVRVDLGEKTIVTAVKESLAALPALTRTNDIYEISLSAITVPSATATLTNAMVVDERSNSEVCGFFRFAGHEAQRVPSGAVEYFAGATAPVGWLVCNGATISRSTYSDLFAAIGTTYGAGNGSTTFKLPDLRGEFIRGWDGGRGVDAGRVIGSSQSQQVGGHTHTWETFGQGSGGITYGTKQGVTGNSNVANQTTLENRPRNLALLPIIKI